MTDSARLPAGAAGRFVPPMPALRTLSGRFPALVFDTAASTVQVGVLRADGSSRWETSTEEAGTGLFRCLARLAMEPRDAGCILFCEGPGSVLGIRTAAMAIRTWHVLNPLPVYAYNSLALLAHASDRPDVAFIADARRDSWHHYSLGTGFSRRATAELAGVLATPESFRRWTPLPAAVEHVPYVVAELLPRAAAADLFHPIEAPDAFLHEEPAYATWTPAVHRAPER